MGVIRCTVRQLREILAGVNDTHIIEVVTPLRRSRFNRSIAIGNARVAFARFRKRHGIPCPFCGSDNTVRSAVSTRHGCDERLTCSDCNRTASRVLW